MSRSRSAARLCPPSFRRGLRLEWLEDRTTPATLFVDDSLVAGTALNALPAGVQVTADRDSSGTLTTGDQVSLTVNGNTTTNLTFNAAPNDLGGDTASVYTTISAAVTAAAAGDTISIAPGTYTGGVTVNKALTLDGMTSTATDVVIDPTAGDGIVVTANGVTIRDLEVTGAANGVVASGVTGLTLNNVTVTGNTGTGLDLTGAAGSNLSLTNVSVTNNTGAGLDVSGFGTTSVSGLTLTGNSSTTASSLTGGTVNVTTTTGNTATTVTASGTSLQFGPTAGTQNQAITLSNVSNLNLTGGTAVDTFNITPGATGGTQIAVTGGNPGLVAGQGTTGDVVNLTGVSGLSVVPTFNGTTNGFSGTATSATTANVTFTGVESLSGGASISGSVFTDTNGNGTQNAGETGTAGATVGLDLNLDGTPDITTTTDAGGNYTFTGLVPGTYRVRVQTQTGQGVSTTLPSDVVATVGQTTQNVTFGVAAATSIGGTISGTLFNDTNGNGTRDTGEAGVSGATVFLDANANGTLDAGEISVASGANGAYSLTSAANGTFNLRAVPTGSFTGSTSSSVTLSGGGTQTGNVGLQTALTVGGIVSGVVFSDQNGNGVRDTGEAVQGGVTVFLDANGNGTLDTGEVSAATGATGQFSLTATTNGQATLRAVPTGSFTSSTSSVVNLTGGNTLTSNVGLRAAAGVGGTVTGSVFVDANGNGTLDTGEQARSGVTVFLDLNGNGQLNAGEPSALTTATGTFSLTAVNNGRFALRAVAPTGFSLGTVGTVGLTGGSSATANVALQASGTTAGGTVTGTVFADVNRNGILDAGEAAQGGVTVFLDANGNGTRDTGEVSATTQANGTFTLTSTTNGLVTVRAVPSSGFASSLATAVNLSGGNTTTANVGLLTSATVGGTATGIVFNDRNKNGVLDAGENAISGVTVFADLNGNGTLDAGEPTAVTGANGAYALSTSTNGSVTVEAVLPVGYLASSTNTTANLTGGATVTGSNVGVFASLPAQATPSRLLAAGVIVGGQARARVFGTSGTQTADINLSSFAGASQPRVASADVNNDGIEDLIVGTGPGVANRLQVIDGATQQVLFTTSPFESSFTGGIYVTTGDLNADGTADIVVTPDEGGGPRVLVYDGATFQQTRSFFGIDDPNFRGGARAAVADINGDGTQDLVVAAGFGGGPRVAFFNGTSLLTPGTPTKLFNDIFVFEQTLRNGVFVTAGDIDADGKADLIVGGGPGGGPRVEIFSGASLSSGNLTNPQVLANFFAGDVNNRGGVRVTVKDLDGDGKADLVAGSGTGAGTRITAYSGSSLSSGGTPTALYDLDAVAGATTGVFVG